MLHTKIFYPKQLHIKKMTDFLLFGDFGLKTQQSCLLKLSQLESLKKNLNKKLKKIGKIWIRPFCHSFITKKPSEVRMGNGKGNFDAWVVNLPAGFIILEFIFLNININNKETNIFSIFKMLKSKIGINCKLIYKNDLF